jgi:hypothetical protein
VCCGSKPAASAMSSPTSGHAAVISAGEFVPERFGFSAHGLECPRLPGGNLAAGSGTQTYLEVQSLRSWAGAGGDTFQRDTLYVRPISAFWVEKYFQYLKYLGPR